VRAGDNSQVPAVSVNLLCGGRLVATKTTDSEGYFEFKFKRPAKPVPCWAQEATGVLSRRLRVR
jgi:hypothetical protein